MEGKKTKIVVNKFGIRSRCTCNTKTKNGFDCISQHERADTCLSHAFCVLNMSRVPAVGSCVLLAHVIVYCARSERAVWRSLAFLRARS